jgi:hypothetical protein
MIGSIGSGNVATATDRRQGSESVTPAKTVADHVAATDTQEPIRSVHTTQGTLVDTYL